MDSIIHQECSGQERARVSRIPVYYCDAMVADCQGFSPSAGKPKAVVASWLAQALPIEIAEPTSVSRQDFYRAHDPAYVDAILDLRRDNGFSERSASVANSLPYTTGAMLAAARAAIASRSVAVAPCSGFHHAGFDHGGGYCTFNGLAVAAVVLRSEGLAENVGILDFDQHYGNGTDDILKILKLSWIKHITGNKNYGTPSRAQAFLARIPDMVWSMRHCDVILYQAGADPHIDDPLGGWLTTSQLAWRDHAVFAAAHAIGVPVAWNLAGGYQKPLSKVLEIHGNTMLACVDEYLDPLEGGPINA
jgi:acetoin utilization deacetylase AcuC-like enzyme